jgi:hypothetical protein
MEHRIKDKSVAAIFFSAISTIIASLTLAQSAVYT